MTSEEPRKPGRRPGSRQVRRGGSEPPDSPQAALQQALEAQGIDYAALQRVFGGPGVFTAAYDPHKARSAAMAIGTLLKMSRADILESVVERDPELAPEIMGRWLALSRVCAEVLRLYTLQGTVAAVPGDDAGPDAGSGAAGSEELSA